MDQVLAKWDALQKAWNGNKLDKVGPILDEIKIALTVVSASFLPLATSSASGKDEQQVWSLRQSIELSFLGSTFSKICLALKLMKKFYSVQKL